MGLTLLVMRGEWYVRIFYSLPATINLNDAGWYEKGVNLLGLLFMVSFYLLIFRNLYPAA